MVKTAQKLSKKDSDTLAAGFRQAKELIAYNRLQEAKNLCQQLLNQFGEDSDILNLMGVIHYRGGDPNGAIGYYKRLLDNDPSNTEALFNLANLLMNLGYREQATQMYESVLIHEPEHMISLRQLNKIYTEEQRWTEAFTHAWKVLRKEPWQDDSWNNICQAVPHVSRQLFDDTFREDLLNVIRNKSNNRMSALMLAARVLCASYPKFDQCIRAMNDGADEIISGLTLEQYNEIMDIPLLQEVLRNYVFPHPSIEKLLILVRRRLLNIKESELQPYYELLLTLAYQCHVNEYVYYQMEEERNAVENIKQRLEKSDLESPTHLNSVLLYASYRPLASLSNATQLLKLQKNLRDKECKKLITLTVDDLLEERSIIPTIPTIGAIENEVSQAVQGQYEENPYPRWIDSGDFPRESTEMVLRRLFPLFDQTNIARSDAPDIFIAGCGTGKHAIDTAQRFANSKVMAIDLSRASLAYAIRKTREYGKKNIDYFQADILGLGQLGRQFDIVESAGVLHHMQEPMKGWRMITSLLKPGGIMKIGLYSAKAREDVAQAREEIKANGFTDSVEDIRRFRHELLQDLNVRTHYPYTNSNDFYNLSECRDLLFHRQEHCFTLPEIKKNLAELGLKFIGFETNDSRLKKEYLSRFPEDTQCVNLDNWHILEQENPDMFFGMYQFWCYKPL